MAVLELSCEDCEPKPSAKVNMSSCCCNVFSIVLLVVGCLFFIIGGVGYFVWPGVLNSQLKKDLALTNTSRSFGLWKETPIPMFMEVYLFNWTNPLEVLGDGAKPNFIETGPYVFTEHHSKVNLVWNNENDTITFNQIRRWQFVPEKSKGTLQDKITNVNVIAVTVGDILRKAIPKKFLRFVNPIMLAEESRVYVTKTVRELIFDGYSDNLLNIFQKLNKLPIHIIKINIPFDKFGWFYQRNNSASYDGVFNMFTGVSDMHELGNLAKWNYRSKSSSYDGECGTVEGSTGELWPPNSADADFIKIFASDICSSMMLSYDGSKTVNGVKSKVHVGDQQTFDNGQTDSATKCFCPSSGCPPAGARNVAKCRFGAPAYLSFPHFYLADPSYLSKVTGLNPSEDLHKMYISLDKITSIPVEVHARLQISILAQSIPGLKFFDGLPGAYMPMIWFDQKAEISDDLAGELQEMTALAVYVEPSLICLTVFGLVLVAAGVILRFFMRRKKVNQSSPLLNSEISESS